MSVVERRLAELARAVANLHPSSAEVAAIADDLAGLGLDDDRVAPLPPPGHLGGPLPGWVQPSGAHDAHPAGGWVDHAGRRWVSLHDGNVHEPGVSGWRGEASEGEQAPPWVQPAGGHDAYRAGDRVTFEGVVYESTIDGNVWSPTVYPQGWTEVS